MLGRDPRTDRSVQKDISLVPEDDAVPGVAHRPPARPATRPPCTRSATAVRPEQCLATVGLTDVADRRVSGFSKGMRQRAKIAASLVTGP